MASQKSARRLLPTAALQKTVEHIMRVSAGAPSGHNVPPWRAYTVAGADRRLIGLSPDLALRCMSGSRCQQHEMPFAFRWQIRLS